MAIDGFCLSWISLDRTRFLALGLARACVFIRDQVEMMGASCKKEQPNDSLAIASYQLPLLFPFSSLDSFRSFAIEAAAFARSSQSKSIERVTQLAPTSNTLAILSILNSRKSCSSGIELAWQAVRKWNFDGGHYQPTKQATCNKARSQFRSHIHFC